MANFDALNAAIAQLSADVDKLVAAQPPDVQPQIDAATAAVQAADQKVVSATPQA